jgi:hypothetical protein
MAVEGEADNEEKVPTKKKKLKQKVKSCLKTTPQLTSQIKTHQTKWDSYMPCTTMVHTPQVELAMRTTQKSHLTLSLMDAANCNTSEICLNYRSLRLLEWEYLKMIRIQIFLTISLPHQYYNNTGNLL